MTHVKHSRCLAPDCPKPANSARGLCHMHYARQREWGALERPPRPTLPERFWALVDTGDECWEWRGKRHGAGYGCLSDGGVVHLAHRLGYTLQVGPIPAGMWVLHHCDNRLCVRGTHLFLGDNLANIADMVAKGRNQHGARHVHAKLNPTDVRAIRAIHAAGGQTFKQIAACFGVAPSQIWNIVHGVSWKSVP